MPSECLQILTVNTQNVGIAFFLLDRSLTKLQGRNMHMYDEIVSDDSILSKTLGLLRFIKYVVDHQK